MLIYQVFLVNGSSMDEELKERIGSGGEPFKNLRKIKVEG